MSQIFHRSANTLSRATIFGAVFVIAALGLVAIRGSGLALRHLCRGAQAAARALQPSAPRCRTRHRLPLLPHLGRDFELCRHPSHQDLHELPFADLDQRPAAGAGSRQLPLRPVAAMDAGEPASRLRFFQSQHSCHEGRGMQHLPRPGRPDAADVPAGIVADGVVFGLPSRRRRIICARAIRCSICVISSPQARTRWWWMDRVTRIRSIWARRW